MISLTEEQFRHVEKKAVDHLKTNPTITNRQLRELTHISYDQAITFFNRMVKENRLKRIGRGSTTRYEIE